MSANTQSTSSRILSILLLLLLVAIVGYNVYNYFFREKIIDTSIRDANIEQMQKKIDSLSTEQEASRIRQNAIEKSLAESKAQIILIKNKEQNDKHNLSEATNDENVNYFHYYIGMYHNEK